MNPPSNRIQPMKSLSFRLALLVLAFAVVPRWSLAQTNLAQPPGQISFQAFLTDGNGFPLASNTPQNFNVTFNIYAAASGGTPLWGESQTVTVSQGYFTVLLGAGNAIPASTSPHTSDLTYLFNTNNAQTRFVGLTVAGVGTGEIAPRLQMQSAPFALLAANAISAANVTGANTISKTNLGADIGVWSVAGSDVYRPSGNVGIGTSTPGYPLDLGSSLGDKLSLFTTGSAAYGFGIQANLLQIHTPASGNDIAFGFGTSGGFSETMRIKGTGLVGIGTSIPGATLDLHSYASQLRLTGGDFGNAELDVNATGVGAAWYASLQSRTFDGTFGIWRPLLLNPSGGSIGIGTANPIASLGYPGGWSGLHVATAASNTVSVGIIEGTTGGRLHLRNDGGTNNVTQDFVIDNTSSRITFGWLGAGLGNRVNAMTIDSIGRLGVGTATPTQAKFVVTGNGGSVSLSAFNYFNGSSGSSIVNNPGGVRSDIGIYCDSQIAALSFFAFSDARIKNILKRSSGTEDLQRLMGIEVTDYTYKDTLAHGAGAQKKVIAQQVERVYPQAVHQTTDVVPDIYQQATIKDGWVNLITDLKVGDRVRLIGANEQGIHPVLEIRAGAFRTDFQPEGESLFVYGREVKDFRSVDYEAISMLNVSATQELARQLAARTAELADLKSTVAACQAEVVRLRTEKVILAGHLSAFEARDADREARLQKLENLLGAHPGRTGRASLRGE